MCFQYVMFRPVMYGLGVSTPPKVEIGNRCARHWLGQVRVCFVFLKNSTKSNKDDNIHKSEALKR